MNLNADSSSTNWQRILKGREMVKVLWRTANGESITNADNIALLM